MENDPLLGDDFDDYGEEDEDALLERARRHANSEDDDAWDE